MNNTREKIMKTLLAFPGSTINNLADAVGINGISIRHHLTSLEADDLVISSEERHGVGRPRLTYTLTDKGVEEFPTNYLKLTRRMLDYLKAHMTKEEIEDVFKEIGKEIAESYKDDFQNKTYEEKVLLVKSVLDNEGFMIEVKKEEDSYSYISLSCPYYRIRQDYPEICILDQTLISELLSQPVKIKSCMFEGDDHCICQVQKVNL
ncbi:MAG: winged helix-turn-helix transcriptional regulator [Chloroflexota bacterium]|nr:winged helix-turn-helix transcriptional regulator [Chloroflexota bacterium]